MRMSDFDILTETPYFLFFCFFAVFRRIFPKNDCNFPPFVLY